MVQDWKTLVWILSEPCTGTYGGSVVCISKHASISELYVPKHIDGRTCDKNILFSKVV